jgi:GTP cyclohydrolase I
LTPEQEFHAKLAKACTDLVSVLEGQYPNWIGKDQFSETPQRITRMYQEFCWPQNKIDTEVERQYKGFANGYKELQVEGPIVVRTLCPHHLLPIRMEVWVGYIPGGKILGLSKFARIAVAMAKRPIMQEQFATEFVESLMGNLNPLAAAVYVEGSHNCMTHRGVEQDAKVATSALRGAFIKEGSDAARAEFFAIVGRMKQ